MNNKTKNALIEWAINFIKTKDVLAGTLQNIEKNKDNFDLKVIYSNKEEFILIEPFVKNPEYIISKLQKEKYIIIFLLNTHENHKFLVDNWKKFVDFPKLTIYFVNMLSNTEKKWAIKPYLHNMIADQKSLKEGLNSMFIAVEPITEESIQKVYKD